MKGFVATTVEKITTIFNKKLEEARKRREDRILWRHWKLRVVMYKTAKFFNFARIENLMEEELISFYNSNYWESKNAGINVFNYPFVRAFDRVGRHKLAEPTVKQYSIKKIGCWEEGTTLTPLYTSYSKHMELAYKDTYPEVKLEMDRETELHFKDIADGVKPLNPYQTKSPTGKTEEVK
jgi:hypothetical protein